jgi:hypothetical protein
LIDLDQTSKEGYALNDSPQPDWVMTETGASVETANVGKVFIMRDIEIGSESARTYQVRKVLHRVVIVAESPNFLGHCRELAAALE